MISIRVFKFYFLVQNKSVAGQFYILTIRIQSGNRMSCMIIVQDDQCNLKFSLLIDAVRCLPVIRSFLHGKKRTTLFRVDENSLEQCFAAHIVQCCQQYCSAGSTMLNNIVDNIKQCGQHNIVQCCFHQP